MIYVIIGIAVLIVAVLAVIAYRLQSKVNAIEAQKAEQERELEAQAQKKRDSMNKSIQILY